MDRYARQRRLAEVGDDGQARLAASRAEVRGGSRVEIAYLVRAGVGTVTESALDAPERFPLDEAFCNEEAREVAASAWRALEKIRRALALEPA